MDRKEAQDNFKQYRRSHPRHEGAAMSTVKRFAANTFIERLYCDCGEEMKFDGHVLTSNPPQYPHSCVKCGAKAIEIGVSYPRKVIVEIKP